MVQTSEGARLRLLLSVPLSVKRPCAWLFDSNPKSFPCMKINILNFTLRKTNIDLFYITLRRACWCTRIIPREFFSKKFASLVIMWLKAIYTLFAVVCRGGLDREILDWGNQFSDKTRNKFLEKFIKKSFRLVFFNCKQSREWPGIGVEIVGFRTVCKSIIANDFIDFVFRKNK